MKVLITGAGGQLGRSLVRAFAQDEVAAFTRGDLDVTDAEACANAVAGVQPDAVVHAAALTDTNRCERDPALARAVNALGSEHVARASARAGARLVVVSTNEVFSGSLRRPYREDDATGPVNAYGLSKLDGEWLAAATCPDTLIVRTSWLYGAGYVNFNEKVLAAGREGRALSFVTDEMATPTSTDDLAQAIRVLIGSAAPPGTYHLTNTGEASRHAWAEELLRLAGVGRAIAAVSTEELRAGGYAGPQKPPYSVLANVRADALGVRLRDWREALAAYVRAGAGA